ncbi:MAG: sigma-70 family RNA polymerase sigma factor [Bacteroidales bacterium]|nr:sigma-70 family RNA polymerase sigma factor [Bacteroidales bacterium]
MEPNEEKTLVEGCLNDNRQAQKRLYDSFAPMMLGVCCRYANSQEEGEDILIEGFTKIFSHLHEFHFECSLAGWMRKIMLNTAISFFRMHHKHHNQLSIDEGVAADWQAASEATDAKVREKDILQLVQQMPETYRVIFNLFVVDGFSHKEIGEMLGIQESTSRSQLTRAKNWLKERISR